MKAFCSNSVQVRTEGDHAVCKCLEHDVGQQDVMHPWKITYANEKVGVLRGRAVEQVLLLKKAVEELPRPRSDAKRSHSGKDDTTAERLFIVGHDGKDYHPIPGSSTASQDNHFDALLGKALCCHWTFSHSPMTLVPIWREARRANTGQYKHSWLLAWAGPVLASVKHTIDGGVFQIPGSELTYVEGEHAVTFESPCFLVWWSCRENSLLGEYRRTMEALGFPIPSSLRVVGFERCLTALGFERGRLLQMYKTGCDTQATTILLLYGASANGAASLGAAPWVDADKRIVIDRL